MRKALLLLPLIVAAAGCQEQAPRSVEYFAAHEAEAKAVVADCSTGAVRGAECDNATAGLRRIASAKAMQHVEQPTTGGKGFTYGR